jgi:dipeptidyl aminopeptidase/acylaminoacyl peptidase
MIDRVKRSWMTFCCGLVLAGVALTSQAAAAKPTLAVWTTEAPRGSTLRYDLLTARPNGGHRRFVLKSKQRKPVTPMLFTPIDWSPDGRRIAFAGVRGHEAATGLRSDIWTVTPGGRRLLRVTNLRDAGAPVYSPDGTMIAFTRFQASPAAFGSSAWAIGPDGTNLRQLTPWQNSRFDSPSSFNPVTGELAISRTTCDQSFTCGAAIAIVKADGSGERTLPILEASQPDFSPDGMRIAYTSTRDRNGSLSYGDQVSPSGEIYTAAADGSDQRRLTSTKLNEVGPAWDPGGTRIAYERGQVTGNAEATKVLQMNPDGTCKRVVLGDRRLDAWYASPVWLPGAGVAPLSC